MARVILALLGLAALLALGAGWLGLARDVGPFQVFAAALAFGFPSLYVCCKRRWWAWWQFGLIGLLAGVLCALPFLGGRYSAGLLIFVFTFSGLGGGGLFWLAAVWRNEGLTCPKTFCLPCGTAYRVARNALRWR